MAIEKNSFRASRFDSEFSPRSKDTNTMLSSEDEEFQRRNSGAVESDDDDDDEFDDCDSGAGSDDYDLLELGESGEEFCQVGNQTCSIPFELYDLPGLHDVLSMEVWNEVLTEEERFDLTQYLPDMDQETFMRTLKDLLTGCNLHFSSPIDKLFEMLKGGLCEPRVALYRQGLNFFQRRQHYHFLQKHQNLMVSNLCQMRDAWTNCRGYSIEEKLRVLNIIKSQKSLMSEKMEELKSDSSEMEESGDGMWSKRGKNRKFGQKVARQTGYGMNSAVDFPSRGKKMALEPAKHSKQNQKGTLKLGVPKTFMSKELTGGFASIHHGSEMKGPHGSAIPISRHSRMAGYDSGAAFHSMDQMIGGGEEEDSMYEVSVQRDQNFLRSGPLSKSGLFKVGKRHEGLRSEEYNDGYMGLPNNDFHAQYRNKPVNQLSDIKVLTSRPSNARNSFDFGKKLKNVGTFQPFSTDDTMKYGKGQIPNLPLKGSQMEILDANEPFWLGRTQGDPFSAEQSQKYGNRNTKSKKWKIGRESSEIRVSDPFDSDYRGNPLKERVKVGSVQNGRRDVTKKITRNFAKGDETESDSSGQIEEDEDDNPLMRSKWAYPSGISDLKSGHGSKKTKLVKKEAKDALWAQEGSSHSSRQISDFTEHVRMIKDGNPSRGMDPKARLEDIGQLSNSSARDFDDNYFSGSGRFSHEGDRQQNFKLGRNGHMQGDQLERSHLPALKGHNVERRKKGEFGNDFTVSPSNFSQNYDPEDDDDSIRIASLARDPKVSAKFARKSQMTETYSGDRQERSASHLIGCSSISSKRRKVKDDVVAYMNEKDHQGHLRSDSQLQADDTDSSKKRGKRLFEDYIETSEKLDDVPIEVEIEDLEPDIKPQKKPFTLITPTVHTGFSFSIIHLLSAVRIAMITLLPEDSIELDKHLHKNLGAQNGEGEDTNHDGTNGNHATAEVDVNTSAASSSAKVPSLPVQELVNRVRSNPGDPSILETQEPLQDLIRGVLKIFSSKTAPLGAKGWKPLVVYEKTNKSWSWIGPINQSLSDPEVAEEVTTPEAWGLPHKMLVKLVDSFANWLKNGQETLQQIGSLPAPPLTLMQFNLDEKERFKDLRAQKSLTTINPSCEEVRNYFRKEEVLRYSIPDRAFAYTAIDGKKSTVAPLRRCGGKPTAKARDHFMLKPDRPPHVTILCLVRDAAARLPGSIGTRADVCTLIRDSQYIVDSVPDAQVNQIVSGALDRLHYERDPCVQFDGERKLWVYLHREREEEDFEDDGTSSTKKWKRQRKEATEPLDPGSVTVAFHGSGEQTGFDLSSDLNVEPSCMDDDKKPDALYSDERDNMEENAENSHENEPGADHGGSTPMVWDSLGFNSMEENKLLCQENSANDDFDDEMFDGEPPA